MRREGLPAISPSCRELQRSANWGGYFFLSAPNTFLVLSPRQADAVGKRSDIVFRFLLPMRYITIEHARTWRYKRTRHCGELSTRRQPCRYTSSGWATSSICTDMILGKACSRSN